MGAAHLPDAGACMCRRDTTDNAGNPLEPEDTKLRVETRVMARLIASGNVIALPDWAIRRDISKGS